MPHSFSIRVVPSSIRPRLPQFEIPSDWEGEEDSRPPMAPAGDVRAAALQQATNGDPCGAARLCREYLERGGDDPLVLDAMAQLMLSEGNDFGAVQLADRAVAGRPDWYLAHLTRGRSLWNYGELEEALKALLRAQFILTTAEDASDDVQSEISDDIAEVRSLLRRCEDLKDQKLTVVNGRIVGKVPFWELSEFNGEDEGTRGQEEWRKLLAGCPRRVPSSRKDDDGGDAPSPWSL